MPETRMVAKLLATSGVTDLIAARLWPIMSPQNTGRVTHITYTTVDKQLYNTTGPTAANGSGECRIQVDCWAATYPAAKALSDAVRATLQDWSDTGGTPSISMCHFQGEHDSPEPTEAGSDEYTHRVSQDYMLQYRDT